MILFSIVFLNELLIDRVIIIKITHKEVHIIVNELIKDVKRFLLKLIFNNLFIINKYLLNSYTFFLIAGKRITSLIDDCSVNNITNLSIPIPTPPHGGIPYSIASMKSLSIT